MQDHNNHSIKIRTERELPYKLWKALQNLQYPSQQQQNQKLKYLKILDSIDQNYIQVKQKLNQPNNQEFTQYTNKLRALIQTHSLQKKQILRDYRKQVNDNQKITNRLTEYEVANSQLKMLLDKSQLQKGKLVNQIHQLYESLQKVNDNLDHLKEQKQNIMADLREISQIKCNQQDENKNLSKVIKCLQKQIIQNREQIHNLDLSEKEWKFKYSNLKNAHDELTIDHEQLLQQIQILRNQNQQNKYQISKCFSVSHNDQKESIISCWQIAERDQEQSQGLMNQKNNDLDVLKLVQGGYKLQQRHSIQELYRVQDIEKLSIYGQQFTQGNSTGRTHNRVTSKKYQEPNSDRRMIKVQIPKVPIINTNIKRRKNPSNLINNHIHSNTEIKNPNLCKSFSTTPNIKKQTVLKKPTIIDKPKAQINKKNTTFSVKPPVQKPQQIKIRKLQQNLIQKQKQNQFLKFQLKKVKSQVVSKSQIITQIQGDYQMEIEQLKQRLQYQKKSYHDNIKTIQKLKSHTQFLKNLVLSLTNKIYISEQYYREIVAKKCQQFLISQCSFVQARKSQIKNAISRLLKFYKDWIIPKDFNLSNESKQNQKRRTQLQDIIEKLNDGDIQSIRKMRFKSSRGIKNRNSTNFNKIQEDQIFSSRNSNSSFYDTVTMSEAQVNQQEKQKEHSSSQNTNEKRFSLKKCQSLNLLQVEESLDILIRNKSKLTKVGRQNQTINFQSLINSHSIQSNQQQQLGCFSKQKTSQALSKIVTSQFQKQDQLFDPKSQFLISQTQQALLQISQQSHSNYNQKLIANLHHLNLNKIQDKNFNKSFKTDLYDIQCQTQKITIIDQIIEYNQTIIAQEKFRKVKSLGFLHKNVEIKEKSTIEKSEEGSQTTIDSSDFQIQAKWGMFDLQIQTQFYQKNCAQTQTVKLQMKDAETQSFVQKQSYQVQTQILKSKLIKINTQIVEKASVQSQTELKKLQNFSHQTQFFMNNVYIQTHTPQKSQIGTQTLKKSFVNSFTQPIKKNYQHFQTQTQTKFFDYQTQTKMKACQNYTQSLIQKNNSQLQNKNQNYHSPFYDESIDPINHAPIDKYKNKKHNQIITQQFQMEDISQTSVLAYFHPVSQQKQVQVIQKVNQSVQTIDKQQVYSFSNVRAQTLPKQQILYIFNKNISSLQYVTVQSGNQPQTFNFDNLMKDHQRQNSSVTSSETLFNNNIQDKDPFIINNLKTQQTPPKLLKNQTRINNFDNNTPSTHDKVHYLRGNISKSPVQNKNKCLKKKSPSTGDLAVYSQLTKQDLEELSTQQMFQKLLLRPQNTIELQNKIKNVEKTYKWDIQKLYLLQIVDQSQKSMKTKKILLWKKGLVSLQDCSQIRARPNGVRCQDQQMFTLGNSQVIARGNHIWVRRKNSRCSSVSGNFSDGNWKIVNLWMYHEK